MKQTKTGKALRDSRLLSNKTLEKQMKGTESKRP
jgi:hypothetical protein